MSIFNLLRLIKTILLIHFLSEIVYQDRISVDLLIDQMRKIMVELANKKYHIEVTKLQVEAEAEEDAVSVETQHTLRTLLNEYRLLWKEYKDTHARISGSVQITPD